jgi:hypothetical protein
MWFNKNYDVAGIESMFWHRFTPELITKLEPNQIFVFGSNEKGIHGAGAALMAKKLFGAKDGVGFGLKGQTFAIPTKSDPYHRLSLDKINDYVNKFLELEVARDKYCHYLVTKIGCGLAGYNEKDIALMFAKAAFLENLFLPREFFRIIMFDYKGEYYDRTWFSSKAKSRI